MNEARRIEYQIGYTTEDEIQVHITKQTHHGHSFTHNTDGIYEAFNGLKIISYYRPGYYNSSVCVQGNTRGLDSAPITMPTAVYLLFAEAVREYNQLYSGDVKTIKIETLAYQRGRVKMNERLNRVFVNKQWRAPKTKNFSTVIRWLAENGYHLSDTRSKVPSMGTATYIYTYVKYE